MRKAHQDFVAKWRNATASADETPLFRLRLDRSTSPFEIAAPSAHCSGLLSIREDGRWCGDIDNEEECEDSMIDGALRPTPRPGYALCYWHHGACRNPGAEARVLYCPGSGVEGRLRLINTADTRASFQTASNGDALRSRCKRRSGVPRAPGYRLTKSLWAFLTRARHWSPQKA